MESLAHQVSLSILAWLALVGTVFAAGSLVTDRLNDPQAVVGHDDPVDRFAGTSTGTLDLEKSGQTVDIFTGPFGVTTGKIGSDAVDAFLGPAGVWSGTVGKQKIDLFTGPAGVTTGTIGKTTLTCFTDDFGNTDCE